MNIYPEARAALRKEILEIINHQITGLVEGDFPLIQDFERARGVIVGLKLVLDLIEETQGEENNDQ